MTKILIADDHAILREGLKQIIEEAGELEVAAEAADGPQVLSILREEEVDMVLLDISLPGQNGLDVLKEIKAEHPQLPVLMLSMHPEEHYAVRAIRAGASGYLTKSGATDDLVDAIRLVARGRKYISPTLAEQLAEELDGGSAKPLHQKLSDREYQILCHIATGKTVTEIADELMLSVKTVSTYRSRILEKMHLKTNAELTYYAVKHQLVE